MSRYRDLVDPSGFQRPCHYLTHYSNAAIVLHYLLRVEPFTSLHIKLQGGKFDCSDRQFYSLTKSWYGLVNSTGDVRELIPEFFCFPDFLSNINKLDLGCLQVGFFTIHFLSLHGSEQGVEKVTNHVFAPAVVEQMLENS